MKKRKLILLLAFVAICTVACILILDVAREEYVATAKYQWCDISHPIHEMQGARRVKIKEGPYQRSWIFEGDSSGRYKIIGSYEQPQGVE